MARGKYAYWLTEEGLSRLAELAVRHTDAELAREVGVSTSTLYEWSRKYSEISEAITRARGGADARAVNKSVEKSLLETALGGVRKLRKPMKIRETRYDKLGRRIDREKIVYVEEEIFVPGNVKAQIFWLTNRDPENWRNRTETLPNADDRTVEYVFREAAGAEEADYAG